MLIIPQTFSSSSSPSSSASTSSSSSSATWLRSRHTPVHVSFMSSYMISGLCLLICSHNNFYVMPCAPDPRLRTPLSSELLAKGSAVAISSVPTLARCQAHRHPQKETDRRREYMAEGEHWAGEGREGEQGTDSSNLCDAWAKRLAFHITF